MIPAHNEESRLHLALDGFAGALSKSPDERIHASSTEFLIISDGSNDATASVARQLLARHGLHGEVVDLNPGRGKGGALKEGILRARGEYVFFSDADLSVPADFLWPMLIALTEVDVVIGSRRLPGALIRIRQNRVREALGQGFTVLTNTILGTCHSDFTCGFKGYRREAAQAIFGRLSVLGWAYDAEALFIARKLKLTVQEVPVAWSDVEGTKVRASFEVLRCVKDLICIRLRS